MAITVYDWEAILKGCHENITNAAISLLCQTDNVGDVYTVIESPPSSALNFIGTFIKATPYIVIFTAIEGYAELFERIADGPNNEFRFKTHKTEIRRP